MESSIQKTIKLIKKSFDQPIVFHILHSHLSYLAKRQTPLYEMIDDWSKILILSCSNQNNLPNQALEIKMQKFLVGKKAPFESSGDKIRIMCVCYYLMSRPSYLINHISLFELINKILGQESEYFDGLIIKILSNFILAKLFSLEANKKIQSAALNRMLEMMKERNLSDKIKIKALPCFIYSTNIQPFTLSHIDIGVGFLGYKYIESFCLYAKHASNESFLLHTLPCNEFFMEELRRFMNSEFEYDNLQSYNITKSMIKNNIIFGKIKEEYEASADKQKFVVELIEFINTLK